MRAHRIDVAATSDFEKGFIKAEVCSYDDYKALTTKPSDAEVKAAGKYRQEGKTYKLLDGDIVHFQVLPCLCLLLSSAMAVFRARTALMTCAVSVLLCACGLAVPRTPSPVQ